jgi:thiamine-phosphate diphosphorylase
LTVRTDWIARSKLWLVLDRDVAKPRSLAEATQLGIEGGVDVVVFRMKDADSSEALGSARKVREVCRLAQTPFVLAHFLDMVEELQPDAFHAGRADKPLPELRYALPKAVTLGYSAHSLPEAEQAIAGGADYLFLGPIFPTPSKEQYGDPLGTEVVAGGAKLARPVVYIGGMNQATVPLAVQMGAQRVAAISALLTADYPGVAAAQLKAQLPD